MAKTSKKSNIKGRVRRPGRRPRKSRRRRGAKRIRDKHVPTAATRAAVQALNAMGETHATIAQYLTHMMAAPCHERSVSRHYPQELALGLAHQKLVVSQGLYRRAAGSPAQFDGRGNQVRAEVKPELTAQIFWLKAQAGWRDHATVTIDPNQKPIPVALSSLTDRQLEEFEARLLAKLGDVAK